MKQKRFLFTALALTGLMMFMGGYAHAQCSSPAAPEGSQVFNSTHDVMQYCDGTNWISMDGSTTSPPVPDNMGNHTATANIDMQGFKIINLGVPTDPEDAATKAYVDSVTGTGETDPKVGALVDAKWCKGDSAGVVQCTFDAPGAAAGTGQCVARDQKTSGTNGGTAAQNAWTKRNFTDVTCFGLTGVGIASGSVNLPAGQYFVDALSTYGGIADRTGTRLTVGGQPQNLAFTHAGPTLSNSTGYVRMNGFLNVKTPGPVDLEYYNAYGAAPNTGLGFPVSHAGTPEVYASMYIKKVSDTPLLDNCSLDGQDVAHGNSYIFYTTQTHANCASVSQSRTCNDGNFDGSPTYQYASCDIDTVPNPFDFVNVNGAPLSTLTYSNIITVSGITSPTPISRTTPTAGAPLFQINGGSWISSGTVNNGDTVRVRITSASTYLSAVYTVINIGGVTDQWGVNTMGQPCTLDGATVQHGDSRVFYNTTSAVYCDLQNHSLNRTCNNGNLSGSAAFNRANCTSNPVVRSCPPTLLTPNGICSGGSVLSSITIVHGGNGAPDCKEYCTRVASATCCYYSGVATKVCEATSGARSTLAGSTSANNCN